MKQKTLPIPVGYSCLLFLAAITHSTTGAPKTAVTVLILSSVGANTVLAIRSHSRQNTLPPRKQAGIIRIGLFVPKILFVNCGTAIPTKEIGPA